MQVLPWRGMAGTASPNAWLAARDRRPINAILFDMDGVLADVSMSYRVAVVETAKQYGVAVTQDDIVAAKSTGEMNNDWVLTHYLVTNGMSKQKDRQQSSNSRASPPAVTLAEITNKFQAIYQGTPGTPGLRDKESLLVSMGLMEELKRRCSKGMAVVTGRPKDEALYFLKLHRLEHLFDAVVTMDDAPDKPDPAPVRLALQQLGATPEEAIMVGDTPSDVIAATKAGVQGFGVLTPAATAAMMAEVYGSFGATTHVPKMVQPLMSKGATAVLLPGLCELLDMVPPGGGGGDGDATTCSSSSSSSSSSFATSSSGRCGEIHRATKETSIDVVLNLDGTGLTNISTGIGFFDHMLDALCKHARFDLELACKGDTYIDDHHTVEDCAIAFGEGKEVEGVSGGCLVVVRGGCVGMDGLMLDLTFFLLSVFFKSF